MKLSLILSGGNKGVEYRSAPVPAALGGLSGSVQNFVPITRVRELDSIISLRDGEVAVLGGLLEDRTGDNNRSVPGLSKLPVLELCLKH